jgi:alpha-ketoglutaric semialdehyde dehydrogenase
VPSELRDKWAMTYRRPIGVAGLITPFNFPLAIPTWKMFPALVCGNAVILKPAEDVPHTHHHSRGGSARGRSAARGDPARARLGEEVGAAIVEHPEIPLISFTGSTATGSRIGEVCGRMHKRLSLEMGGKNAQIVMPTRIPTSRSTACSGARSARPASAARRPAGCCCTRTSTTPSSMHSRRASALRLGNGLDDGTDVGPLINEAALEKVRLRRHRAPRAMRCWRAARRARTGISTRLLLPAHHPARRPARQPPRLRGSVRPRAQRDPFHDLDEAIRINNEVEYGLSSSIYTNDVRAAFRAMNELDNGITYVNAPTIGAEAHLPFGGVKKTGNGHREGGWEVYEFYSETKVCYVDYSGIAAARADRHVRRQGTRRARRRSGGTVGMGFDQAARHRDRPVPGYPNVRHGSLSDSDRQHGEHPARRGSPPGKQGHLRPAHAVEHPSTPIACRPAARRCHRLHAAPRSGAELRQATRGGRRRHGRDARQEAARQRPSCDGALRPI